MQSKCAGCGTKKSRFVKEQEAKGLLSRLGLKTRISEIPLIGDIFFWLYKTNKIVKVFLLVDDNFMPELHSKQSGFTYSACGPFTKNKERIEKFIHTVNTDFIYRNDLDKACFQHDMAYDKSEDLAKRTQSDKVLRDKASKIASDPKHDGYQRGLALIVYKFFAKKYSGSGVATVPNYQLANELHRQINRKFKRQKFIHPLETVFGV